MWGSGTRSHEPVADQGRSVKYTRVRGNVTNLDRQSAAQVRGRHFVVGIPWLSTTFEVSKSPYQDAGTWKMVVDGVELTRVP
jgi:hypothetical protein